MSEDPYLTLSITSPGPATLPAHEKRQFAPRNPCDISDIDGASSQSKYRQFTNKPIFLNNDIPGAQPKQLIRGRNVRDNSLYIDDIEGTRRAIKDRMMRTNRHVNPLEPSYPLPSFVPVETVEVPFRRDCLNVDDIEGTKPRPKKEFAPKSTMDISDIDGARPGLRETKLLNSIQTRNILHAEDVCRRDHRHIDRTTRVSDPCAPVYTFHGMEIKDGRESKPKPLPKETKDGHLLQTKDITGANSDTRYASPFPRREYRNTNFIADIEGSHADSIKHSIRTNRMTHPLQPVYQSLDPGEMLLPLIPPLIPPEMVKIPTLPALDREKSAQNTLSRSSHQQPGSSGSNNNFDLLAGNTGNAFGATGAWESTSNTNFASTTGFNFYDRPAPESDLDPVLFTAPQAAATTSATSDYANGKPPTGRKQSLALPFMPMNSGRENAGGPISGKDRAMNTGGLVLGQQQQQQQRYNRSNPSSNQASARGNGVPAHQQQQQQQRPSYGNSPMVTGRANGGNGSARRSDAARLEEINLVRQLQ